MIEIKLLSKKEIMEQEFYNGQLSVSEENIFDFSYEICMKLAAFIQKKINNGIFRTEINNFYLDNKDECLKCNLKELIYFDDIIFQSGLCFIEDYRIRDIVFNYLFSFHASLRRGEPTRLESFTYFVK